MTKLLTALTLAILLVVACAGSKEADQYLGEMDFLDELTDATDYWSELMDREARIDVTTLTRVQALEIIRENSTAAQIAYEKSNKAIGALMQLTPPEQCEEAHIVILEALQLTERGFLELKRWMNTALRQGKRNEDARIRGNQLLNEADLVKQRGLNSILECK